VGGEGESERAGDLGRLEGRHEWEELGAGGCRSDGGEGVSEGTAGTEGERGCFGREVK